MFNKRFLFLANFLLSVLEKEVGNRSIFGEDMDKSFVSYFLNHGVKITTAKIMLMLLKCND